jgi:type IV fimbrial biogenesis protein FimT
MRCVHSNRQGFVGHRSSGFSLIEVMIVVSIMAILMLSVIQWGPEYVMNNRIRSATETFRAGLAIARNEASKLNRPVNLVLDSAAQEWRVEASENIVGTGAVTTVYRKGSYADTGNVTGPLSAGLILTFDGFGRLSSSVPASGPAYNFGSAISTCQAAGGKARCLRVVLPVGGQATVCDPALSYALDPKGCKP